jgi:hypothetical protein
MKKEATIGAATALAIAAMVGISLETGPRQEGSARSDQGAAITRAKPSTSKAKSHQLGSGCGGLAEQLETFLDIKELVAPKECYAPGDVPGTQPQLTQTTSQLKFVIALLPDPVHTHQPVLFDQFVVAIQEGAQDEKYDFDSSWLPWDDDESTPYALLADQKTADLEKGQRESQPGIILFRKSADCSSGCENDSGAPAKKSNEGTLSKSYREGLVVFVVGEEATQGIHAEQFRNALAWIAALEAKPAASIQRLAILGPTFSGSFPSVAQALSESEKGRKLDLTTTQEGQPLAIYSGSVSGADVAQSFHDAMGSQITFHSFVQSDDEILRRFCNYIRKEQPDFDAARVAIISEDETAYGRNDPAHRSAAMIPDSDKSHKGKCPDDALTLHYPRDISALRGAYQTKSLFAVGTSPQSTDSQKRSLPTDLADPSGKVQDSIHSFGGNQTPLNQEAFLLEMVAALRELNARYILLRSSSTLDQLFLTDFLRRGYPDGRIVIFGSDLMSIRERGSTGLSGTMTLSTYPLFPLERDWTEYQSLPAADRIFSSDTSEGTYVAFRLLLDHQSLDNEKDEDRCHVLESDTEPGKKAKSNIFLPPIACKVNPIPDYSPPFWMLANQCGELKTPNTQNIVTTSEKCYYPGPATWLSVIGANRLWPMASLTEKTSNVPPVVPKTTDSANQRKKGPGGQPEMPLGMKIFLLVLMGFSLFHAWCCWAGSYTAKPAFLAHFASHGEWRHTLLIFLGSFCVACLAIEAGWGCGVFSKPATGLTYPWFALVCVSAICLMAWLSVLLNNRTVKKLSEDVSSRPERPQKEFDIWNRGALLFLGALLLGGAVLVLPLEWVLLPENRALTYWRAMHLTSGVSAIVPILLVLAGMYLSFWFTLHGLALFGPDRPCLPPKARIAMKDTWGHSWDVLRMFSQEDAARKIEDAARPFDNGMLVAVGLICFALFLVPAWIIAGGVPVRSLGAENYAKIFLVALDICCTLAVVETWRLCKTWEALKRLLAFLDRLPLRRTMASLRGFSWGGVWKMSGNVLEVRYKVISRQMECMNHTIASLQALGKASDPEIKDSLEALAKMHDAGITFATWYSINYDKSLAGDLGSFSTFQQSISSASGTLLSKLLVPFWKREKDSLLAFEKDETAEAATCPLPPAPEKHIQNAEEFVCLNYLAFIQNVLGRLRTMTLTIMLLLIVSTVATSTYPFDPQEALSAVFIVLFVLVGVVIVKVYADMHRDSTLSHVTNTKPGELGTEFWFKILGFGFAPLLGLLARLFPAITDFVFSWLQPGISSLK